MPTKLWRFTDTDGNESTVITDKGFAHAVRIAKSVSATCQLTDLFPIAGITLPLRYYGVGVASDWGIVRVTNASFERLDFLYEE